MVGTKDNGNETLRGLELEPFDTRSGSASQNSQKRQILTTTPGISADVLKAREACRPHPEDDWHSFLSS